MLHFHCYPTASRAASARPPLGTLLLLALNLLAFPLIYTTHADALALDLDRLVPAQWLTSNFLHADPIHLCSNLIYLWVFGSLVESFVGTRRFLALTLAIAVLSKLLQQLYGTWIGDPGRGVGGSEAICGLMAISLLWAPFEELSVGFRDWTSQVFRWISFEVPVLWFCGATLALELLALLLLRGPHHSYLPRAQLLGAALGFAAGALFLRARLVATGGHDLWTLARHGPPPERDATRKKHHYPVARALARTIASLARRRGARAAAQRYSLLAAKLEHHELAREVRRFALALLAGEPKLRGELEVELEALRQGRSSSA